MGRDALSLGKVQAKPLWPRGMGKKPLSWGSWTSTKLRWAAAGKGRGRDPEKGPHQRPCTWAWGWSRRMENRPHSNLKSITRQQVTAISRGRVCMRGQQGRETPSVPQAHRTAESWEWSKTTEKNLHSAPLRAQSTSSLLEELEACGALKVTIATKPKPRSTPD